MLSIQIPHYIYFFLIVDHVIIMSDCTIKSKFQGCRVQEMIFLIQWIFPEALGVFYLWLHNIREIFVAFSVP
jgi:hypothetical protein